MNGLAEITIAGQKVGLKFGMPAIRRIVEKMQELNLLEGNQANELGNTHILYAGYLNFCAMHDHPPTMAFPAFYDYVETAADDANRAKELIASLKEFEESRFVKEIVENHKKKVTINPSTSTKSNPSASVNLGWGQESTAGSHGDNTPYRTEGMEKGGRTNSSTRGRSSTRSRQSTGTKKTRYRQ